MSDRYDEQHTSGRSVPLWYGDHPPEETASKLPSGEADIVVIGAGVAGLSVAYHALRQGRSVVILDKGAVGSGETGRSSAHVASALDDHFYVLERLHGLRGAELAAESHQAAIETILSIARREMIACDARRVDGYLFAKEGDRVQTHQLELEYDAARRAGLEVHLVDRAPLPFTTGPALRFANQAEIDPMAYLRGLAVAVERLGGVICTEAHVEGLEEAERVIVRLRGDKQLSARQVVVATNTPINDLFAIHSKQAAYRTYVLAVEVEPGTVQRGLYWDLTDPYHYVRLAQDDLLLVGGEDHKVGQSRCPEQSWERLLAWTRAHFPSALDVRQGWSGQVFEPADGLAFIGRNPGKAKNVFIVTGDSGNGITHGAIAGLLLTDLMVGRKNRWEALYDPSRKMVEGQALRTYVKENLNVARQYTDWVRGGQSARTSEGGFVERRGVHRVAVYVDERGARRECSARCPHLGGAVRYNRAEGSWDCPAHGSRFDPRGRVLTGPATSDLTVLADQEPDELDSAQLASE